MADHFAHQRRELAARPVALAVLWVRAIVDAVRHGMAQRMPLGTLGRWSLHGIHADVRFAVRLHRRNLGPVVLVTAGLAMAVGLSTALVTITRTFTNTSVGLDDPERYFFAGAATGRHEPSRPATTADLPVVMDRLGADAAAGILAASAWRIDELALPRPAAMHFVTANFFRMTGARFERGAGFEADPALGLTPPLVISRAARRHYFPSVDDAEIVGRQVRLNGRTFIVSGVAAREFTGPDVSAPAFWAPLAVFDPDWREDGRLRASAVHWLRLLVRLPDGAPASWAESRLAAVFEQPVLRPVEDRAGFREAVPLTMAVGGLCVLLLLLGCVNVGALVAATNVERRHELRTRVALGASRSRLIRQLLTEGVLLGGLASLAGVWCATWIGPVLLNLALRPAIEFHLDAAALGLAVIAALASGVVSSLWPAWRASGPARPPHRRSRRVLLTMQAAVCLSVLAVAGLLERGAVRAQTVAVGFDADKVWAINALVGLTRSAEDGLDRLLRAEAALSAHPAIEAVAVGGVTSFGGSASMLGPDLYDKRVGPGWFSTIGIPLLAGRDFTADDGAGSVAIVSRSSAMRAWGRGDVVGEDAGRVHPVLAGHVVVGVAADAVPHSLLDIGTGAQALYRPLRLEDHTSAQLIIRSARPASEAFEMIRATMAATFPEERVRPVLLDAVVADYRDKLRAPARALSIASTALLVLALIGIAGVAATYVRLRQHDLAVHVVLGADRRSLRALVMRQYLLPVTVGIIGGAVVAVFAGFGMRAMLLDVHPVDPLALGGAAVVLFAGAWLASSGSARRAGVVEPADVLRQ
jgi:predicted permease